jgi:hypothetical protein
VEWFLNTQFYQVIIMNKVRDTNLHSQIKIKGLCPPQILVFFYSSSAIPLLRRFEQALKHVPRIGTGVGSSSNSVNRRSCDPLQTKSNFSKKKRFKKRLGLGAGCRSPQAETKEWSPSLPPSLLGDVHLHFCDTQWTSHLLEFISCFVAEHKPSWLRLASAKGISRFIHLKYCQFFNSNVSNR